MREYILVTVDDIVYTADVEVTYARCSNYGADYDGNRGIPTSIFIEEILIHEIEDDNGDLVEITEFLRTVVENEVHKL